MFDDKVLLITGGTGTFGNAVLRRFLQTDIGEIRIFCRDEKKQDDMRRPTASDKLKFYIGDVRDPEQPERRDARRRLRLPRRGAQAGALVRVLPAWRRVRTNVLGAENVMNAAIAAGVQARDRALSTDKAVYPINAMGISKAMMEKLAGGQVARAPSRRAPRSACTRYGNVMASRGSVIPLFIEQIQAGEPLTITDPDMTRFMMSIDDAVDLVLYAFEHGSRVTSSCRRRRPRRSRRWRRRSGDLGQGRTPRRGHRHAARREAVRDAADPRGDGACAEDMGDYYRVPADNRDLNYGLYFDEGRSEVVAVQEDYNSHNTERLDVDG